MIKFLALIVLFAFSNISSSGQSVIRKNPSLKEKRKSRSVFLNTSYGLNTISFRDFATSPLLYNGNLFALGVERERSNSQRESLLSAQFAFGNAKIAYNGHVAISKVKTLDISYSQLYEVKLPMQNYLIQIGGMFSTLSTFRVNEVLRNNGYGYEAIPTIFASVKVSRGISSEHGRAKKLWFIKIRPKNRKLTYRLNVGLINSSIRNGYVYAGQDALLNEFNPFDEYEFNVFSGYRFSSSLDYVVDIKNKNKVKFFYNWHALKTGGDFDNFEMANHNMGFALMFNTNNK